MVIFESLWANGSLVDLVAIAIDSPTTTTLVNLIPSLLFVFIITQVTSWDKAIKPNQNSVDVIDNSSTTGSVWNLPCLHDY